MNSPKLKNAKRAFMLCALLLVSNLANAQWELRTIEMLTEEANRLIAQGLFESAYDLYPEIMFQIRIREGLFSAKQLPMLIEMSAWHARRGDYDQADNLLVRAEFYIGKNPDPVEGYRNLVVQRLYLPDEQHCFERKKDGYLNSSAACDSLRYFRADSFIAATEVMIKAVKISDDRRSDLRALANLAELTALCLYDMYGTANTSYTNVHRSGHIYKLEKIVSLKKYRFHKWTMVRKRALSQLETEFELEV